MQHSTALVGSCGDLRYLVSVPQGAVDGLRRHDYPLLCFLHGFDEAAPLPLERGVTRHGPLRRGGARIACEEFVVVAPQLSQAGDHWFRYAGEVDDLLAEVMCDLPCDPQRTYLTGFSFGGNGVFDLALMLPGRFAALWAVDPTHPPQETIEQPVWVSIGEAARRRTPSFIDALGLHRARLDDSTDGLQDEDRVFTDHGLNHVDTATEAYEDERAYRWLLARRSAD